MDPTQLRNALVELHAASFCWAVVCCRGDRSMAEDVLQSVYVRLLESKITFEKKSSFRTWLFGVIRNSARNYLRGRWWSSMVGLELSKHDTGTIRSSREAFGSDETTRLRHALKSLPKRQHQIIHLVFYEQMTIAQSAEVMNITVGSARQHYERAKQRLRVCLAAERPNSKMSIESKSHVRII